MTWTNRLSEPCTREPAGLSATQGKADTKDRLRRLVADKREAKAELRHVLERLAVIADGLWLPIQRRACSDGVAGEVEAVAQRR